MAQRGRVHAADKKLLIDKKHCVTIELNPDKTMANTQDDEETARLAKVRPWVLPKSKPPCSPILGPEGTITSADCPGGMTQAHYERLALAFTILSTGRSLPRGDREGRRRHGGTEEAPGNPGFTRGAFACVPALLACRTSPREAPSPSPRTSPPSVPRSCSRTTSQPTEILYAEHLMVTSRGAGIFPPVFLLFSPGTFRFSRNPIPHLHTTPTYGPH